MARTREAAEKVSEVAEFGRQTGAVSEHTRKLSKRNEQARIEIENVQAETEDDGQKIKAETLNEAEQDLEIRALREGEGRRGNNASQSNGCCVRLLSFHRELLHVFPCLVQLIFHLRDLVCQDQDAPEDFLLNFMVSKRLLRFAFRYSMASCSSLSFLSCFSCRAGRSVQSPPLLRVASFLALRTSFVLLHHTCFPQRTRC